MSPAARHPRPPRPRSRDPRHLAFLALSLVFFAVFLAARQPWADHAAPLPALAAPAVAGLDGFPGFPVDLNAAGVEELAALPGIGPVTASRIVEERERLGRFTAVDDLVRVRWISADRVERLRGLVTVSAAGPTHAAVPGDSPQNLSSNQ